MKAINEKDAKKKYCPLEAIAVAVISRDIEATAFCLGSRCMMWISEPNFEDLEGDYGYCGLAGKP